MKEYYFYFHPNQDDCTCHFSSYAKKDVFDVIKEFENSSNIRRIIVKRHEDYDLFSFRVWNDDAWIDINLHISKKDPYLKKINRFYSKHRFLYWVKPLLGLGVVTGMLAALGVSQAEAKKPDMTLEQQASIDDFFDTYLERNKALSKAEKEVVMTFTNDRWLIENPHFSIEEVSPYLEVFDLDHTLTPIFENAYQLSKEEQHKSLIDTYYDANTKNIKKEVVLSKILSNMKPYYRISGLDLVPLTEEETKLIVDDLYQYIALLNETNTTYDLESFFCFLDTLEFYKIEEGDPENNFVQAYSLNSGKIIWNTFHEELENRAYWKMVNEHEFTHLRQFSCPCRASYPIIFDGNSIIQNTLLVSEDDRLQVYRAKFYVEACAEREVLRLHQQDYNVVSKGVYEREQIVFTNIEYALSVNPDYHMYDSLRSNLKHDPISFYQNFPCLVSEEEMKDYIFMLKCYDLAFHNGQAEFESLCEQAGLEPDYHALLAYAQEKNIELFYKNLMLQHERYENVASLPELISYETSLISSFHHLLRTTNGEVYEETPYALEALLYQGVAHYIDYLHLEHPEIDLTESQYEGDSFQEKGFPSFIDEEKQKFYACFADENRINPMKVYQKGE